MITVQKKYKPDRVFGATPGSAFKYGRQTITVTRQGCLRVNGSSDPRVVRFRLSDLSCGYICYAVRQGGKVLVFLGSSLGSSRIDETALRAQFGLNGQTKEENMIRTKMVTLPSGAMIPSGDVHHLLADLQPGSPPKSGVGGFICSNRCQGNPDVCDSSELYGSPPGACPRCKKKKFHWSDVGGL